MMFTNDDWKFLQACGVDPEDKTNVHVAKPDSTVRTLIEHGVPVNRENWLKYQFAGPWPDWAKGCETEPLPEGCEEYLPKELRLGEDPDDGSEEDEADE